MTGRRTYRGLLVAALVAVVLLPWLLDPVVLVSRTRDGAKTENGGIVASPAVGASKLERPPLDRFAAIVERPVFVATRRPAFADKTLGGKKLILGKYQITGVIISPEERIVMMTSAAGKKTVTLRPGDKIDGWSLVEVSHGRIVLASAEKRIVIRDGDGQ